MRDINSGAIVFNLSGGAILITVFAYMGFAFFHTDIVAPCTARYPAGKQFALDSQRGNLLTPIELQGRAGSREWGILTNAQILGSGAGNDAVMQVSLASTDVDDETARNGVGFTWQSAELAKATSACLSYRVFLPASFAFAKPGYLPGLYAASDIAELDAKTPSDGYVARVGWAQGGGSGVEVRSVGAGTLWQGATVESGPWPLGRWVPVEQEIALNSKGAGDGILRLWIDGKLRIENRSLELKSDSSLGFSGVVADIGYAHSAGDPVTLKVSPFVVQWQ